MVSVYKVHKDPMKWNLENIDVQDEKTMKSLDCSR